MRRIARTPESARESIVLMIESDGSDLSDPRAPLRMPLTVASIALDGDGLHKDWLGLDRLGLQDHSLDHLHRGGLLHGHHRVKWSAGEEGHEEGRFCQSARQNVGQRCCTNVAL